MLLGAWAGLCLALLASSPARAAGSSDFLPGAKAMGMGGAFAAVADDPWALWHNPAGTANTPYIQLGTGLDRHESPIGMMTAASLAYIRPYEPINTATIGAGYLLQRQVRGGDKDELLFHYSQEVKLPRLPLSKPLRVGGNFKFMNVEGGGGPGFGSGGGGFALGFDGGIQLRSNSGLAGGVVLRDLTSNIGIPHPTITLATAYTWQRWLTLAGDMRVNSGVTEFYPGLEAAFHQGLLKARVGRGFQLDGVTSVAFGLGVNFSPVILDVAMTLPVNRVNQGGAYQMSFSYKFGAPSFAGNFVGQAAAEAETLRGQLESLRERKKTAEVEAKTADTRREIAEGELRAVEQRVRELQDDYRGFLKRRDEAGYEAEAAETRREAANFTPPKKAPLIRQPAPKPPPPGWPRKHEIRPGDTLRTLARQYYGDPNLWEKIYDANREKVERGLPQEGSVFSIPDPSR